MSTTEFHYTTYIKSTPERVWMAITTPEFCHQYWGNANYSDWKIGSRWEHRTPAGVPVVVGTVTERVEPKRLVLTWAATGEQDQPGKQSRVTFELEAIKDMVCLRIAHEQLEAGSSMAKGISGGWPRVLSSLKSMLETGVPLDIHCSSAAAKH